MLERVQDSGLEYLCELGWYACLCDLGNMYVNTQVNQVCCMYVMLYDCLICLREFEGYGPHVTQIDVCTCADASMEQKGESLVILWMYVWNTWYTVELTKLIAYPLMFKLFRLFWLWYEREGRGLIVLASGIFTFDVSATLIFDTCFINF